MPTSSPSYTGATDYTLTEHSTRLPALSTTFTSSFTSTGCYQVLSVLESCTNEFASYFPVVLAFWPAKLVTHAALLLSFYVYVCTNVCILSIWLLFPLFWGVKLLKTHLWSYQESFKGAEGSLQVEAIINSKKSFFPPCSSLFLGHFLGMCWWFIVYSMDINFQFTF